MKELPTTIAEQIDCLARLTGAPETFIEQVKDLFHSKGISLEADASPFLPALEEAFRREEHIRSTSQRARQSVAKMQANFQRIGRAYVDQISQQNKDRKGAVPVRREAPARQRRYPTHITIKGDHRTLITRPEREEMPMVPGPEEIQ